MGVRQGTWMGGLAALLVAGAACGAEFKPLPGHEYREFVNPPTPVSGVSVVGATLLSGVGPAASDELWVYLRQPFNGQLNLEIVSADGRFLGRGAFVGSSQGGEWVALNLVPGGERASRPPDPEQETVAVSAQAGKGDAVLVASWGVPPSPLNQQQVRLFVNSRSRQAQVSLRVDPDPRAPRVKCKQLPGGTTVRFDTVCTVRIADLPEDRRITLVRRDGLQVETQVVTLDL